jgi:putative NIF3 family GTP cyclohydrolase 1 type 2
MDVHEEIGTTSAMVRAIGGNVEEGFRPFGGGYAGAICAVDPISTQDLMALLRYLFGVTFVDFAGRLRSQITRMAVTAGAGCDVDMMQQAEARGAQAYLTGEILDRGDDPRAYRAFKETQDYARTTGMSLLGVSHAASEFLVMKTQLVPWLRASFSVGAELIPLRRWWR